MEPTTADPGHERAAAPFAEADLDALRRAKHQLETPPLGIKLAAIVGAPVEKLIARLPGVANDKVTDATQIALRKCLQLALKTLGKPEALVATDGAVACCTSSRWRPPAPRAAHSACSRCRSSCPSRPR